MDDKDVKISVKVEGDTKGGEAVERQLKKTGAAAEAVQRKTGGFFARMTGAVNEASGGISRLTGTFATDH